MNKLMKILLFLVLGSMALGVVGSVIGLAFGLVGLLLALAVPAALVGGVGALVYYMFKRGYNSTKRSREKAEPMEQVETEVVEEFRSFFNQQ